MIQQRFKRYRFKSMNGRSLKITLTVTLIWKKTELVTLNQKELKYETFQKLPTLKGKNIHKHIPLHNN